MDTSKIKDGYPLKRFLVFAYFCYYPNGGISDLRGSADDLKIAQAFAATFDGDIVEIIDSHTGERTPVRG